MVRTRFAPSPTGFLHIGGVRTALFNWLYARRHGGQFILRIDDTDQQRNVAEALAPILHGFRWLGLNWDEGAEVGGPYGPYYQSEKLPRYREAVRRLLDSGHAYWDYATEDEMKAERAAAEQTKKHFQYSRRWMAETEAERGRFESEGRKGVVRLKIPREGKCVFDDRIRGRVEVDWTQESDHVIERADGSALYNLANVVDDFDMKITHVIRSAEHLSNTPRQIFIAQSLGYPLPEFVHVPFVAETGSKNKLSKRKTGDYLKHPDFRKLYEHGEAIARTLGMPIAAETFNPVSVDFYERVGYLPDAILNYLVLLGWSLDDKTEFFTSQEMIDAFSLERVHKAPASFDARKLFAFQERYMNLLTVEEKAAMTGPYLVQAGLSQDKLPEVIRAAADRIKIAGDILDYANFFLPGSQVAYDEAAFDKRIRIPEEAPGLLRRFADVLQELKAFDAASIEQSLQRFVEFEGIRHAQIVHALRVAVTGKTVGFGLFEGLEILGEQNPFHESASHWRGSNPHNMDLPVNTFKQALKAGKPQIGIWSFLCSAIVSEILSNSGFDWVLIDTEHAPNELPMVQHQLHAMQSGSASAVVRAAWNDRVMIKRLLDIGAQSLLLPYVQTAEEAMDAVVSMRYPPEGLRGVAGLTRAAGYGRIKDYIRNAASELCLLVQVETRKGISNIDAIASVDGVDGVFIGPSDLSTDMGHFGNWRHPEVQNAIESAAASIRKAGKAPGILVGESDAQRCLDMGYLFVAVASDIGLLRAGDTIAAKFKK